MRFNTDARAATGSIRGYELPQGTEIVMQHAYRFAVAMAALVSMGCVSTKTMPLDSAKSAALAGKTIVLAQRRTADFAAMSSSKSTPGALLGPIGGAIVAAAAISRGNEIVRSDHIEDPAVENGRALLAELAQKDRLIVQDNQSIQTDGQEPEEIVRPYTSADLVLDVATINWSVVWFPGDWSHYGLVYRTKLTLIDVKKKTAIAEAFCARRPEKQPDSPTYDELLQDNAARLKALIKAASDTCRDELREKLFGAIN